MRPYYAAIITVDAILSFVWYHARFVQTIPPYRSLGVVSPIVFAYKRTISRLYASYACYSAAKF